MTEGNESKTQYCDGEFYNIIVFDYVLSASEVKRLNDYLRKRVPKPELKLGFLRRLWRRIFHGLKED